MSAPAVLSGYDSALREEAWRAERAINFVRVNIFTIMCTVTALARFHHHLPFSADLVLGYGWAGLCAIWARRLKREYIPWIGAVGTCGDTLIVSAMAVSAHAYLLVADPAGAIHHQHALVVNYILVLCQNFPRYNPKLTFWTTVLAVTMFLATARTMGPLEGGQVTDVIGLLVLGLALGQHSVVTGQIFQRARERDALARFLPSPVVDRVTADPAAWDLGGKEQEATVLFADIRGFTAMSEEMKPAEVVGMLNEYFGEMVAEIFQWDGILDKFIGDGLCAVFVAPLNSMDHAERAIRCGLGMLNRLEALNQRRVARGERVLSIGVGVHTGKVVAGNVGSSARMEYTHIGDTVNTASRVESMTKEMGVPLLVSEATYARAEGTFVARPMPPTPIRGKSGVMRLFAIERN